VQGDCAEEWRLHQRIFKGAGSRDALNPDANSDANHDPKLKGDGSDGLPSMEGYHHHILSLYRAITYATEFTINTIIDILYIDIDNCYIHNAVHMYIV